MITGAMMNRPLSGYPVIEVTDPRVLSPSQAPAALHALAERVRRLSLSHSNPQQFHEDKSEIENDLRMLAKVVHHG